MGFLDKLLGRTKQAVDTAEEKMGMHDHDHGDAAPTAEAAAPAEPAAPAAPDAGSAPEGSGESA
jgi:hypothetical protein